jgi:hypothetical protein
MVMMKKIVPMTLLMLASLSAVAAPNMQPGMWEITTKMEMAGMEGMPAMPPQTIRQCIRPADVQSGSATVPKGDPQCTVKGYKVQGNTASWQMECTGANAMTGNGTVTYSGASYSGKTQFTMHQDGQAMTMNQTFSGKRVGDCK